MIPRIVLSAGLVLALVQIASPASGTTLYTWRNADGSLMFTDDPRDAPPDVQVHVWADVDAPSTPPETPVPISAPAPPISVNIPERATQGMFAMRLVSELGLRERSDADDAADLLSRYRIAPRLGRWELDQPIDPGLTVRLRRLTVASAAEGWIDVAPEEALLAFDTTAALLGVVIPEPVDVDAFEDDYPSTIADTPPLVYAEAPPPELYPYYAWQPWPHGYWWNGVIVSGVYILDADRYGQHRRHHHHKHREKFRHRHWDDHHANMPPDRISHHVRDRVTKGIATEPSDPPRRVHRSAGTAGPMQRPPARLIESGSSPSGHTVQRRQSPPRQRHQTATRSRQAHPSARSIAPNVSTSELPARMSQTEGRQARGFSRD
jgi:hypothetical protein